MTVKTNPVFPACKASFNFNPKPNPTMETCNKRWMYLCRCFSKGLPMKMAKIIPKAKAIGEEINGVRQKIITPMKIIFCEVSF